MVKGWLMKIAINLITHTYVTHVYCVICSEARCTLSEPMQNKPFTELPKILFTTLNMYSILILKQFDMYDTYTFHNFADRL